MIYGFLLEKDSLISQNYVRESVYVNQQQKKIWIFELFYNSHSYSRQIDLIFGTHLKFS